MTCGDNHQSVRRNFHI